MKYSWKGRQGPDLAFSNNYLLCDSGSELGGLHVISVEWLLFKEMLINQISG